MRLEGKEVFASEFLTEARRRSDHQLQIPELNSGFTPAYWCAERDITEIRQDAHGDYIEWQGEGMIPLTRIIHVQKEGNYMVHVTLYTEHDLEDAMIFLGRRRLAWRGRMEGGKSWSRCFVMNVCPIIPRTYTTPMEDLTLDVTVLGAGLHLTEIEVEACECRTLYIAGDSTVADQSADYPYLPGNSYSGWGQMIQAYLNPKMAVSNHSHSGLTTESFRSEGHYQILYDRIRKNDICLFQFGHNDQKLMHLMAEDGYRSNLIQYIQEIRSKGAVPVLVTPLARNSWKGKDNSYNDLLAPYANACIDIGKEHAVPIIDLHERSMSLILSEGRERAKRFFFPSDYTHSNDYGALRFAWYVFQRMKKAELLENTCIQQDLFVWEPPEVMPILTIPDECRQIENPNTEHLFEDLERPEDDLTRVEALELINAAMHFFSTNVYNDMFTDVIGHETYAGVVECAWQNGMIPDTMVSDHRFYPKKRITGEEFLILLMNGYQSRKTIQAETFGELPKEFQKNGYLKRRTAADICRNLSI